MAQPFLGYTDPQATAIHQALIKAHLKRTVNWPRLLKALTDVMYEATAAPPKPVVPTIEEIEAPLFDQRKEYKVEPGVIYQETAPPEPVVYRDEVRRRFTVLLDALDAATQAHAKLGEALQQHLDDQQWPNTVDAMRQAVVQAMTRRSPYGPTPTTGAPKHYVMRWAVRELLHIFEWATGIVPTVYASQHADEGYDGNFYPFAVACLAPVRLIPPKQLGSAVLTGYKEWRDRNNYKPAQK